MSANAAPREWRALAQLNDQADLLGTKRKLAVLSGGAGALAAASALQLTRAQGPLTRRHANGARSRR